MAGVTTGGPDRAARRTGRSAARRVATVTGIGVVSVVAAKRRSGFPAVATLRRHRPGTGRWNGNGTAAIESNATGNGTGSWSVSGIGRPSGSGNVSGRGRS
uniref:(northern house mosquito) hypothetical protein n=1 Tax=Culex pipiens TaxID=7175 RepID=A0A8D8JAK7_CULPI